MKIILDLPKEYVLSSRTMWEWVKDEFGLHQLHEYNREVIRRSCVGSLHAFISDTLRYGYVDEDQLDMWREELVEDEISQYFDRPDYRELLTDVHGMLESALMDECCFAMMLGLDDYDVDPDGLLSHDSCEELIAQLATTTNRLIESAIDLHRPITILNNNLILPDKLYLPNPNVDVEVNDVSRCILLRAA